MTVPLAPGCGTTPSANGGLLQGGTNTTTTNVLTALAVAPGNGDVAPGRTLQFAATGTFTDGSTQNLTSAVTWSSGTAGVATVDASGLVTGVATGQSTLTATLNGISGSALVNVVGASTVTVNNTLLPRALPNTVNQIRLTGFDANGNVQFGPETQPVVLQNVFLNVPINVTSLQLEYLTNGILVGTFVTACGLTDGGNFVVNDPDWQNALPQAARLVFEQQPVNGATDFPLAEVKVTVQDQFGNTFPGATNPISLSLITNPGNASLAGTASQTPVNGVATFNDLVLDQAANGYQFLATSQGLSDVISVPFNVVDIDPGVPTGQQFLTMFNQTQPETDGDGVVFPGQANYWDLDTNYEVGDGNDDIFDGAWDIDVGGASFPSDQTFAEQTWLTPLFTAAEGIIAAAVYDNTYTGIITGNFSAALGPASQVSVRQTVDLTSAVIPINLDWNDIVKGNSANIGPGQFNYQVMIRDTAGNPLSMPFQTNVPAGATAHNVNLDGFAGQSIQLCFEADFSGDYGFDSVDFDDVRVTDNTATQFVTNGTFETGNLNGWTVNVAPQSQNMVSGSRNVSGLDVVRRFYTRPDQLWCRYLDFYTNNTAAPIVTTVNVHVNEGSDSDGDDQFVPGTNNRAMTSVDTSNSDRDWGWVFGTVTGSDITPGTGSNDQNVQYDITVGPGQTVVIVTFGLMSNEENNRPRLEALAQDIVANFRTNPLYLQGMNLNILPQIINL